MNCISNEYCQLIGFLLTVTIEILGERNWDQILVPGTKPLVVCFVGIFQRTVCAVLRNPILSFCLSVRMKLSLSCFLLPSVSGFLVEKSYNLKLTQSSSKNLFAMPCNKSIEKSKLYPFGEARKIARGHGFANREEFLEYSCPGAYQLPKNPEEVWAEEWTSWEDFLGICHDFEAGRKIARTLDVASEEEYLAIFQEKRLRDDDLASRLPYRPDLKFKQEWKGWGDWLGNPEVKVYNVE
jgi:hypothetical protein